MNKGYIVNTATMGGSQGEVAHIDLTNGTEIVRVLLTTGIESDESGIYHIISLTAGKADASIMPNSSGDWQTIWNNRLDVIDSETWYVLYQARGGTVYGTKEEARAIEEKQYIRYRNKHTDNDNTDITSDATIKIVTPLIRRKTNVQRVNKRKVRILKQNDGGFKIIYAGFAITRQ